MKSLMLFFCAGVFLFTGCASRSASMFNREALEGLDVSSTVEWLYEQEEVVAAIGRQQGVENISSQKVSETNPLRIGMREDTLTIGTAVVRYQFVDMDGTGYEVREIGMIEPERIDYLSRYQASAVKQSSDRATARTATGSRVF